METTTPETPTPVIPELTPTPPTRIRTTFLTVICILTFIGSGWGLLSAIRSYAAADTTAAVAGDALKNAQDQMNQQDVPGFFKQAMNSLSQGLSPEAMKTSAILEFISNLFTLFGAILMWNLKKTGFYLYIAGIVVLVAAPFAMGKLVGAVSGFFYAIIGIAFIIMYAVNLKCMNKPVEI